MDGILSQEEINALLNNSDSGADAEHAELTDIEQDAIGEIANISMGTAATTLFSLVNRKVLITTPVVSTTSWDDLVDQYEKPCVFIQIAYTVGLDGSNILVLKENDVKVITDLMMGGDGTNTDIELGELHLSAISEAMNQMMGSSATSLSSMLNMMIDISPPKADLFDLNSNIDGDDIAPFLAEKFIKVSFRMEIEGLVDSVIMQLYPFPLAREMYRIYATSMNGHEGEIKAEEKAAPQQSQQEPQQQMNTGMPNMGNQMNMGMPDMNNQMNMGMPNMGNQMNMGMPNMGNQINMGMPNMGNQMNMGMPNMGMPMYQQPVNVHPAQFQAFSGNMNPMAQRENIDLIMDVPLEVTVELGRTTKSIQDILEFAPGTIIELNKIAGEPIDVLVNGKYVAKGEVVVIEESFGVRVLEIIK